MSKLNFIFHVNMDLQSRFSHWWQEWADDYSWKIVWSDEKLLRENELLRIGSMKDTILCMFFSLEYVEDQEHGRE